MTSRSQFLTKSCNAVATAVFGAAAVLTMLFSDGNPLQPLLLALGATAFGATIDRTLSPPAFAAAAVVQLACLFELLGFTVRMTTMAQAGILTSQADRWWVAPALWALLTICCAAFVLSALGRRGE